MSSTSLIELLAKYHVHTSDLYYLLKLLAGCQQNGTVELWTLYMYGCCCHSILATVRINSETINSKPHSFRTRANSSTKAAQTNILQFHGTYI